MTSSDSIAIAAIMSRFQNENGDYSDISEKDLLEALASLQSSSDTKALKSAKKKKGKASKDPNKPKRPQSAYFLWLGDNRSRIKAELVEADLDSKVTDVSKEAGRQWRELESDAKTPFEELSITEKQRYKSEMEVYEPVEPVEVYTVEEYPSAPSGWSGPFQMKYLYKNAKNSEGKSMSFKSFDEAIEAAAKVDGCGGITKTSRGYSLRVGPDLISNPAEKASQGLASWIKGDPETLSAMTETTIEQKPVAKPKSVTKPKSKPKSKTISKAPDVFDESTDEEDEEEVAEEEVEVVKHPKTTPKKALKKKEPEPVVDSASDEDLDVEEVVIDGKTYFKTEEGELYDPDTQEVVGENGELF